MGFKEKFFQDDAEKSSLKKDGDIFSESHSLKENFFSFLKRYKNKTEEESVVGHGTVCKNTDENSLNDFEASSDGGYVAYEDQPSYAKSKKVESETDKSDQPILNNSAETDREILCFEKNGVRYEIENLSSSDRDKADADCLASDELEYVEDQGYVSGKVLDYDDSDYIKDGVHRIAWKRSAVEGTEESVIINKGEILSQWSHHGTSGTYFCKPGTEYDDLQLYDVQENRELKQYEVAKVLPMKKSIVNKQDFIESNSTKAIEQYVPELKNADGKPTKAEDLVKLGYLKEIDSPKRNN